ncbi:MAG: helix-hairpin-helix domain-containing protein [Armatimonadetes bacterium]|nr:helix-hairpin-helix domain-containing protein [Armatimonadota bacterium]
MPTLTRKQASAALALFAVVVLFLAGTTLRGRATSRRAPAGEVTSVTGATAPPSSALPAAPPVPLEPLPSAALPLTPVPARPPVVVHVVGCVRQPGVFAFQPGARVYDAVKRAGGAQPDADLEAVNLAARLEDGAQVCVPRKVRSPGQESAASAPASAPAGRVALARPAAPPAGRPAGEGTAGRRDGGDTPAKLTSPSQGRVNLNRADARELQRLPWVGPATAERIIQYRETNGPFRSVDELLEIRGIGEKRLADIRDLVTL